MPKSSPQCAALITGFGPFPGVPHNVSGRLAEEVGDALRKRFTSSRIVTAALPTEWEVAPERISDMICDLKPAVALHFGVSDQASGFVIETVARNATGRVDAAGTMPNADYLEPFGPDELATQLPAGRIHARLRRLGLPSRLSRDAGTYLCNAVFYRSVLTQTELGLGGQSGFIHLPVAIPDQCGNVTRRRKTAGTTTMDLESVVRGGIEILSTCLGN